MSERELKALRNDWTSQMKNNINPVDQERLKESTASFETPRESKVAAKSSESPSSLVEAAEAGPSGEAAQGDAPEQTETVGGPSEDVDMLEELGDQALTTFTTIGAEHDAGLATATAATDPSSSQPAKTTTSAATKPPVLTGDLADPLTEQDENIIMQNKIINEEYKIWKKNAPFMYDLMYSRALNWPTLTTQWFPDMQELPDSQHVTHRLLLGTHTSDDAANYLQVATFQVPKMGQADPDLYNPETEEVGGHGTGKKSLPGIKFEIVQKIDHHGEVNKARYMPQNPDLIATIGVEGRVCVFDRTKLPSQPTGTVNPQIELKGHKSEGFGLNWNPGVEGRLVTGSEDCTVRIWDIQDYTKDKKSINPFRTYTHHSAVVNDVEFHPLLPWMVATVSDDLSLQILDLRKPGTTEAALAARNAHSDAVNAVAFNPGSEYLLATGSADKTVAMWDLRCLKVKTHACEHHKDIVSHVEWHPTKKFILGSAGADRRIKFWDLSKVGNEQLPEDSEDAPPELHFTHGGHTNRIADFSFNKNDPWLMCSAAEDNLLMCWKAAKPILESSDTEDVPLQELEH